MEPQSGYSNNDALVETDTSHQEKNVPGKEPLKRCTTAMFVTTNFASDLSIDGCYQRRLTPLRHSSALFTKASGYYRGLSGGREQDPIAILGSSQHQASFAYGACRQLALFDRVTGCFMSRRKFKVEFCMQESGVSPPPAHTYAHTAHDTDDG